MSFTLHGIGVSGGIAIGHAHLVSHAKLEVSHYVVPPHQVPEEAARFDAAIGDVRAELEEVRASIPATAPAEFGAFIDVHLMILSDSTLSVDAAQDHRERAMQRRVGAQGADGRAARPVRRRSRTPTCASARPT